MDYNFIKVPLNLNFFYFIFKKFYIIYLFDKVKFLFYKIKKNKIKIIFLFNFIFFFSYKKSIIKFFFIFLKKENFYMKFNFKRVIKFIGKGNKFLINLNRNLLINNEFSHLSYFNFSKINFILIKYNRLILFFNNFSKMTTIISLLENLKKKDLYNGKGIVDFFKKIKLKPGKRSSFIR